MGTVEPDLGPLRFDELDRSARVVVVQVPGLFSFSRQQLAEVRVAALSPAGLLAASSLFETFLDDAFAPAELGARPLVYVVVHGWPGGWDSTVVLTYSAENDWWPMRLSSVGGLTLRVSADPVEVESWYRVLLAWNDVVQAAGRDRPDDMVAQARALLAQVDAVRDDADTLVASRLARAAQRVEQLAQGGQRLAQLADILPEFGALVDEARQQLQAVDRARMGDPLAQVRLSAGGVLVPADPAGLFNLVSEIGIGQDWLTGELRHIRSELLQPDLRVADHTGEAEWAAGADGLTLRTPGMAQRLPSFSRPGQPNGSGIMSVLDATARLLAHDAPAAHADLTARRLVDGLRAAHPQGHPILTDLEAGRGDAAWGETLSQLLIDHLGVRFQLLTRTTRRDGERTTTGWSPSPIYGDTGPLLLIGSRLDSYFPLFIDDENVQARLNPAGPHQSTPAMQHTPQPAELTQRWERIDVHHEWRLRALTLAERATRRNPDTNADTLNQLTAATELYLSRRAALRIHLAGQSIASYIGRLGADRLPWLATQLDQLHAAVERLDQTVAAIRGTTTPDFEEERTNTTPHPRATVFSHHIASTSTEIRIGAPPHPGELIQIPPDWPRGTLWFHIHPQHSVVTADHPYTGTGFARAIPLPVDDYLIQHLPVPADPRFQPVPADPRFQLAWVQHDAWVMAVAFGRVGGLDVLATAGADGTVWVWDVSDPRASAPLGQPLRGHTGTVMAVVFGRVGGLDVLATAGADGTVRVWDVSDPRASAPLGQPLRGHTGTVMAVVFGRVGGLDLLATASDDETVRVWDASDPHNITPLGQPLHGHTDDVTAVVFGRVGDIDLLATTSIDRTARVWDASDPHDITPVGQPLHGHTGTVMAVVFGRVGGLDLLATASDDGTVRVWDASDPHDITLVGQPLRGHDDWVRAVVFGRVGGLDVLAT
ncbi:WD40 repeat domain-containing protein, partial [Micromonospora sp. NPDC023814]|uniref:WD40 repeat domain-containing protein n=1 Tax=Micromonospora sp. NPDC023814 TaxID=3154596 RepID=UPI0033C70F20